MLLRAFTPEDFDALFAIYSRADVARYLYQEGRTQREVRELLETKVGRAIEGPGGDLSLAVVRRPTTEVVGSVVLRWLANEHRQGEIGFVVHPDHQGQGYASEAARVLLRIAFADLGLHRVVGRIEARNAPSARVLEKLGMRREAHLVENEFVKGEWQSEIVYAILEREWSKEA